MDGKREFTTKVTEITEKARRFVLSGLSDSCGETAFTGNRYLIDSQLFAYNLSFGGCERSKGD